MEKMAEMPAAERINALFAAMHPSRRHMTAVLESCVEPQSADAIESLVSRMQEHDRSVFGAATLCRHLEEAGALSRISEEADAEPEIIEEDGVSYVQPAASAPVLWQTTEAGKAALTSLKAAPRIAALLAEDAPYERIYKNLIALCARPEGATASEMDAAVSADPLSQNPKRYAAHFFKKLEQCDAIAWDGSSWKATDEGRAAVGSLTA